jgi:superfamily II DNA or RNA helicase
MNFPVGVLYDVFYPAMGHREMCKLSMTCRWIKNHYESPEFCRPLPAGIHLYPGQYEAAMQLYSTCCNRRPYPLASSGANSAVFLEGSTGSGKTITALYFMLKCIRQENSDTLGKKILWIAPPGIAVSTIDAEIRKFFPTVRYKVWYTHMIKKVDSSLDDEELIIVSNHIFQESRKEKNGKRKQMVKELLKQEYRFVAIDEAHLLSNPVALYLTEKFINYTTIVLLTASPPKNIKDRTSKIILTYWNATVKEFEERFWDENFEGRAKILDDGIPQSPKMHEIFIDAELTQAETATHILQRLFPVQFSSIFYAPIAANIGRFELLKKLRIFEKYTSSVFIGSLINTEGKGKVLLDIMQRHRKCLIFSQSMVMVNETSRFLRENNISHFVVSSKTTPFKRSQKIEEFKRAEKGVLVSTPHAGGIGINYHLGVNTVILLEPFLKPNDRQQAIGRIDRIGQKSELFVYQLSSEIDRYVPNDRNVYGVDISQELRLLSDLHPQLRDEVLALLYAIKDQVINYNNQWSYLARHFYYHNIAYFTKKTQHKIQMPPDFFSLHICQILRTVRPGSFSDPYGFFYDISSEEDYKNYINSFFYQEQAKELRAPVRLVWTDGDPPVADSDLYCEK